MSSRDLMLREPWRCRWECRNLSLLHVADRVNHVSRASAPRLPPIPFLVWTKPPRPNVTPALSIKRLTFEPSWPVLWLGLSDFQGAQVRRPARETVVHSRNY